MSEPLLLLQEIGAILLLVIVARLIINPTAPVPAEDTEGDDD